jgi:hypothetical protein
MILGVSLWRKTSRISRFLILLETNNARNENAQIGGASGLIPNSRSIDLPHVPIVSPYQSQFFDRTEPQNRANLGPCRGHQKANENHRGCNPCVIKQYLTHGVWRALEIPPNFLFSTFDGCAKFLTY